jgi:hypothetical protein
MEIGQPTELVTVVAATPMLETANATTGQSISTAQVEDIPLNGRNPMMLAQLAIGVVATGNPNTPISPFANGAASGWSIGGTSSQTSEIMIDGAPNATWDNRVAYSPPQEAVQEVKVKAFDGDAGFGHTGGGTINKVMKTGTNKFRGSAYYYMQPSSLAANNFFNNRAGIPVQETKFNQWGGTAGGPVRIPKLYDGRNKLFWFFAFERISGSQPNTKFLTVPTEAERKGDFSSLLALGSTYQIYNPYSGVLSGTTVRRSPFYCDAAGNPITPNLTPGTAYGTQATGTPCNKLPQQLLNPVALAYLKFYPAPTCCLRIHSAYSARRLCSGKRMSSNSVSMRAATDSTRKPLGPRPAALLSGLAGHRRRQTLQRCHSARISHPFFWACRPQARSNRTLAAPILRITMPCLFRMTGASSAT